MHILGRELVTKGDLLQSVGVFIISLFIYFVPTLLWLDPLITLLFSLIVIFTTVPISRDCFRILLQSPNPNFDHDRFRNKVLQIEHVNKVKELRVWELNDSKTILTMKLEVSTRNTSEVLLQANYLCKVHKIFHQTIQIEEKSIPQ